METLESTSDETLIERVAHDEDDDAFRELVRRYQDGFVNLAYRYTGNAADAEDIASEAFFRVWKYAGDFRGTSRFSTWAYRIAVNACLNYRRDTALRRSTESLDETIATDEGEQKKELPDSPRLQPETAAHDREQSAMVRQAIDHLPPTQKMAFVLSWFEGDSYAEIAELMKISISAVESLLFRAKQTLKKTLKHGRS